MSIIKRDEKGELIYCNGDMFIIGQRINVPYCYVCDKCNNVVYI